MLSGTHAVWPSGLTRKGKSTYISGMLLYEQNLAFETRCVQVLLPTYKKKEFLSMYVPTYAVAANSTHTNAQRNSCFVNELDGATEVRHDMGVPPICRIAKLKTTVSNSVSHSNENVPCHMCGLLAQKLSFYSMQLRDFFE